MAVRGGPPCGAAGRMTPPEIQPSCWALAIMPKGIPPFRKHLCEGTSYAQASQPAPPAHSWQHTSGLSTPSCHATSLPGKS